MKVVLTKPAVEKALGSEAVVSLQRIIYFAVEGRHVVLFDTNQTAEMCLSTFNEGTRSIYSNVFDQAVRQSATLPADIATIIVTSEEQEDWNDPTSILSLQMSVLVLQTPLCILVENSENDWFFIRGLMRISERQRILEGLKKDWIEILHGGGATISKQILRRFECPHKGLRTFVVFDSDRMHPDELNSNWSPVSPQACGGYDTQMSLPVELGNRHWMLKRRSIESYMPKDEIRICISANIPEGALDAFCRMGKQAQWHYNMKKGFNGDNKEENRGRCKTLYDSVNDDDRASLSKGFGRNLANQYREANSRSFNWDDETLEEAAPVIRNLMRIF